MVERVKASFYDHPDRVVWVQPAVLGLVVASWDETLYDDYFCLLSWFKLAANSVDKNSKKSTRALDHWKLINRCRFL